jgi:hypothetical protein
MLLEKLLQASGWCRARCWRSRVVAETGQDIGA